MLAVPVGTNAAERLDLEHLQIHAARVRAQDLSLHMQHLGSNLPGEIPRALSGKLRRHSVTRRRGRILERPVGVTAHQQHNDRKWYSAHGYSPFDMMRRRATRPPPHHVLPATQLPNGAELV